jgi:hypothetical protein
MLIRIGKSKKDWQHNGKKKKDKRTNNDLLNIRIKLKIEEQIFFHVQDTPSYRWIYIWVQFECLLGRFTHCIIATNEIRRHYSGVFWWLYLLNMIMSLHTQSNTWPLTHKYMTSNTQIHDHSHTCLSTETSRKRGGVKLVKNCLLSEMMEIIL